MTVLKKDIVAINRAQKQLLIDLHGKYINKNSIIELLDFEPKKLTNFLAKKGDEYLFRLSAKETKKYQDMQIVKFRVIQGNLFFYNKNLEIVCMIQVTQKNKKY